MDETNETQTPGRNQRIVPGTTEFTLRLRDLLSKGKEGDVLTDEQMTRVCGANTAVGEKGYGYLRSAVHWVFRNKRLYWRREYGAGCLRCLGDREKVEELRRQNRHVRKSAGHANRLSRSINLENLPPEERDRVHTEQIQTHTVDLMTKEAVVKKIEARKIIALPRPDDVLRIFRTEPMPDTQAEPPTETEEETE